MTGRPRNCLPGWTSSMPPSAGVPRLFDPDRPVAAPLVRGHHRSGARRSTRSSRARPTSATLLFGALPSAVRGVLMRCALPERFDAAPYRRGAPRRRSRLGRNGGERADHPAARKRPPARTGAAGDRLGAMVDRRGAGPGRRRARGDAPHRDADRRRGPRRTGAAAPAPAVPHPARPSPPSACSTGGPTTAFDLVGCQDALDVLGADDLVGSQHGHHGDPCRLSGEARGPDRLGDGIPPGPAATCGVRIWSRRSPAT